MASTGQVIRALFLEVRGIVEVMGGLLVLRSGENWSSNKEPTGLLNIFD